MQGLPASLWPLVLELAGGGPWPPAEAHAEAFVAQAEREALLPLLLDERDPPPALARALTSRRALARVWPLQGEAFARAVRATGSALGGAPFVLLKGADYRQRLYARPELRPMQDLDVLVPRAGAEEVGRRLLAAGAERCAAAPAARLASHHEAVFLLEGVVVEVHHSFLQRPRHAVDYDALWARRRPAAGAEGACRLEDADALVAHALALAVDEFSARLVRYVDLWLLLQAAPDALVPAVERAAAWDARRALYGALRQLGRLFPEAETAALREARERLLPARTRRFLDGRVLPPREAHGRGKNMTRAQELWRKLWLMDGPRRRLAFAAYHAWASLAGRLKADHGRVLPSG